MEIEAWVERWEKREVPVHITRMDSWKYTTGYMFYGRSEATNVAMVMLTKVLPLWMDWDFASVVTFVLVQTVELPPLALHLREKEGNGSVVWYPTEKPLPPNRGKVVSWPAVEFGVQNILSPHLSQVFTFITYFISFSVIFVLSCGCPHFYPAFYMVAHLKILWIWNSLLAFKGGEIITVIHFKLDGSRVIILPEWHNWLCSRSPAMAGTPLGTRAGTTTCGEWGKPGSQKIGVMVQY